VFIFTSLTVLSGYYDRRRVTGNRRRKGIVSHRQTGYVDAREAARMLGMSQRAVRNLVGRNVLEGKREGAAARLVMSLASVERLRSERQWEHRASEG
jgi:hypothetical protein